MLDLSRILALIAVPIFIVAAGINVHYAWKCRPLPIRTFIFILIALVSFWNAIGYMALFLNLFPDVLFNVVWFRPVQIVTGMLFSIIPGWLISVREALGEADKISEVMTRAHDCEETVETLKKRLVDREQAITVYQELYEILKKRLAKYEQR